MGYKAWRTPTGEGSVFQELMEQFRFTMDAAASHANHLLPRYCTEGGKYISAPMPEDVSLTVDGFVDKEGKVIYPHRVTLSETSGLDVENWRNEVVFCNPPYDKIMPWVLVSKQARDLYGVSSVLLLPPSIDTDWFAEVWPKAAKGDAIATVKHDDYLAIVFDGGSTELRFLRKRIRFWRPQAIITDGDDWYFDETDPRSVPGESPRAGNLVVIHRG